MCWMSFSSNALLLKRARNMKPRESQVAKCAMSASTRVHAALEQWILRAEATASDSEDETIPGLPWTSNWAGASSHLLDDSGSITSTQVDTEVVSSQEDSYPLPIASPVHWADKWAREINDEFEAPMPRWAIDWAEELKTGYSGLEDALESLPDSSTIPPSRKISQPPTKKLKTETRSMDLRVMMCRLSKTNEVPTLPVGPPLSHGTRLCVPAPFWTAANKAEAEAAVQAFTSLTHGIFATGAKKSVKFTCVHTMADGLEVARRLEHFFGKDKPPLAIELLSQAGQWQPPGAEIHVTTGGNENNTVLRMHFPRKSLGRSSKGACASIQINNCKGQPGARPVTVQGAKQCFHGFQTNWVMCLGPLEHRDGPASSTIDAFM